MSAKANCQAKCNGGAQCDLKLNPPTCSGGGKLEAIELADGSRVPCEALFAHPPQRQVDLVSDLESVLRAALVDRPPPSAKDDASIREGFDAELDAARKLKGGGTEAILALEADLRKETGAASLRVKYARVFGWTIEVTKSHLAKVPSTWRRKQTVAQGERYTTDELDKALGHAAEYGALEYGAARLEPRFGRRPVSDQPLGTC